MNKICFYHDDLDGYCSVAIVNKFYDGNIDLYKINHGEVEFLNTVKSFDEVIFVDFTPPLEYIESLSKNNKKLIVLDHHKTASDLHQRLHDFSNTRTVLDLNHAGCVVTWKYFYPDEEMPYVVKLVEDFDIWKWELGENTEFFVNGMDMFWFKSIPSNENWANLLKDNKGLINEIINCGETITQYKHTYNTQLLESLSYEATFKGYKILVCNAPKNNSKVFGDKIKDYPFVAIYSHKQDQYIVSLYSATGFDTTTISTQMIDKNGNRGGGHAGASGFKCVTLPWIPIKEGN